MTLSAWVNRLITRGKPQKPPAFFMCRIFSFVICFATTQFDVAIADEPTRLESQSPANLIRVTKGVYVGGEPNGKASFERLAQLGVVTVVSVDGSTPRVDEAENAGMRYVHLPLGYEGVSELQAKTLAKAIAELPRPVYIHCHHGRHRAPAAAAIAAVGSGMIERADALALLRLAGTAKRFRGVFDAVRKTERFTPDELKQFDAAFPSCVQLPSMTTTMAEISHCFDALSEAIKEANSAKINRAAHHALLIEEAFAELSREAVAKPNDQVFRKLLRESYRDAKDIRMLVEQAEPNWQTHSRRKLVLLKDRCKRCHARFRF